MVATFNENNTRKYLYWKGREGGIRERTRWEGKRSGHGAAIRLKT
jgi:hypothetical protein